MHHKYIDHTSRWIKKGTPILYVRLKKAIYGLLRSSLLFYRKLRGELEAYGFKINPYEKCVGNKMMTTKTVVTVIDKKEKNNPKQECFKEYGLLRSSLLFYRKICGELEAYGFKINPYDPCVGKKW